MTRFDVPEPGLYRINPHFSDTINHNIIQSEIDGGVYLRDVPCGAVLNIQTHDWDCTMIYCGEREALVIGHPRLCPEWVRVYISGSTWGGSMLKEAFIGRGMHLEFIHPVYRRVVTSEIADVRVRALGIDQRNAAAAEVNAGGTPLLDQRDAESESHQDRACFSKPQAAASEKSVEGASKA